MRAVVACEISLVPTVILAIFSKLILFMDAQLSLVEYVKPLSYKSSKVSVPLFIAVTASINDVVKRAHAKSRAHVQGDYL